MRKFVTLLMVFFGLQLTNGQVINVNGVDSFFNVDNNVNKESDIPTKFLSKIYLSEGFKPAVINDEKKVYFLRFNIYKNQMEFAKDAGVYNMKKAIGTKVHFRTLNVTYECINRNGRPTFFKVYDNNDNTKLRLLTRESVRYVKAEKALHGYDVDKPAKYVRTKDQQYFSFNNQLIEVPKKKKTFYAFFKSNVKSIKDYMKKEKLGYKNPEDLNKVVAFYNSLENHEEIDSAE